MTPFSSIITLSILLLAFLSTCVSTALGEKGGENYVSISVSTKPYFHMKFMVTGNLVFYFLN